MAYVPAEEAHALADCGMRTPVPILLGALSCPMGMSVYVGTVSQRGRGIAQPPYPWSCTTDVTDNRTVTTARPT